MLSSLGTLARTISWDGRVFTPRFSSDLEVIEDSVKRDEHFKSLCLVGKERKNVIVQMGREID